MDHEKKDMDRMDDVILPGFRFHPTDEELVGFYRVTRAGFWKATGTDRPIYSSDGTKCIGLKKSLVFYRGKAAKGTKTDWMMHEFRLPSLSGSMPPPKKLFQVKNIPANDAWAICKIFKKAATMAQRVQSQRSDLFNQNAFPVHFSPENISSCSNEITGAANHLETISYPTQTEELSTFFTFSPNEMLGFTARTTSDATSLLNKRFEHHNTSFEGAEQSMNEFYNSMSFPQAIEGNIWEEECQRKSLIRFPFSLSPSEQPDA